MDEVDFLLLGFGLSKVSLDFFLRVGTFALSVGPFGHPGLPTQIKRLRSAAIARAASEFPSRARSKNVWKRNLIGFIPLGLEPRLTRHQLIKALCNNRRVRKSLRFIQPNKDIAGLDVITFAYAQFPDNAAGRMLNFLDTGIHDQNALADHSTG